MQINAQSKTKPIKITLFIIQLDRSMLLIEVLYMIALARWRYAHLQEQKMKFYRQDLLQRDRKKQQLFHWFVLSVSAQSGTYFVNERIGFQNFLSYKLTFTLLCLTKYPNELKYWYT